MKTILEFINRNTFNNRLGKLIFQLDEDSKECLSNEFKQLLEDNNYSLDINMITEMSKYPEKYKKNKDRGNREVWKSKDGDTLQMGGHSQDRLDRPVEKGGDGEHIDQEEIINMFRYAWDDIIDEYNEGYLDLGEYNGKYITSFVIQCKPYIVEDGDELVIDGARPENKFLWSAFFPEEADHYKVNIIIKTLFRGATFKHVREQRRIIIANNGYVKQILPR